MSAAIRSIIWLSTICLVTAQSALAQARLPISLREVLRDCGCLAPGMPEALLSTVAVDHAVLKQGSTFAVAFWTSLERKSLEPLGLIAGDIETRQWKHVSLALANKLDAGAGPVPFVQASAMFDEAFNWPQHVFAFVALVKQDYYMVTPDGWSEELTVMVVCEGLQRLETSACRETPIEEWRKAFPGTPDAELASRAAGDPYRVRQ